MYCFNKKNLRSDSRKEAPITSRIKLSNQQTHLRRNTISPSAFHFLLNFRFWSTVDVKTLYNKHKPLFLQHVCSLENENHVFGLKTLL